MSVIVKVEHFDAENVFLSIPDEILEKLNCKIGDEFHVAVVQPNCIVLTKCPSIPELLHIEPSPDFKMFLTYVDGYFAEIDLSDILVHDVYANLRSPEFFRRAEIRFNTIVWPDDTDIAPESLYQRVVEASKNR